MKKELIKDLSSLRDEAVLLKSAVSSAYLASSRILDMLEATLAEAEQSDPEPPSFPVKLRIGGNQIVDPDGRVFTPLGVACHDPQNPLLTEEVIAEIASHDEFNSVRLPVLPGCVRLSGIDDAMEKIARTLDWCEKYGLYVLLDWHTSGNPLTGTGKPRDKWGVATREETLAFWLRASREFGDRDVVIGFEFLNEPLGVTWAELGELYQELIGVVRPNTEKMVFLAGSDYAGTLLGVPARSSFDSQVALIDHPYVGQKFKPRNIFVPGLEEALADGWTLLLSELGYDPRMFLEHGPEDVQEIFTIIPALNDLRDQAEGAPEAEKTRLWQQALRLIEDNEEAMVIVNRITKEYEDALFGLLATPGVVGGIGWHWSFDGRTRMLNEDGSLTRFGSFWVKACAQERDA